MTAVSDRRDLAGRYRGDPSPESYACPSCFRQARPDPAAPDVLKIVHLESCPWWMTRTRSLMTTLAPPVGRR